MSDLRAALLELAAAPEPTLLGYQAVRRRAASLTRRRWATRVSAPVVAAALVVALTAPRDAVVQTTDFAPAAGDDLPIPDVPPSTPPQQPPLPLDDDGGPVSTDGHQVVVRAPGGVAAVTMFPSPPPPTPPVSPDGRKLAVIRNEQLHVMDADGTNGRQITTSGKNSGRFSWSPDGRHIVVGRTYNNKNHDLYIVDVATGEERRLTSSGDATHPLWSPDGRRIIFNQLNIQDRPGGLGWTQSSSVAIINVDGSGRRTLRDDIVPWGDWAPDSRRFVTISGEIGLCILDVDTGHATEVPFEGSGTIFGMRWSPDGEWLLILPYFDDWIVVQRPDGSESREHSLGGGRVTSAAWAPDSQSMVLTYSPGNGQYGGLYRINRDFTDLAKIPGSESAGDPVFQR